MINQLLKQQVDKFNPNSLQDIKNALKECLQQIILCELSKTDFFNYACFYGGTSLRICHKLNRFSEDLDFTIFKENDKELIEYLITIENNIRSYGLSFVIKSKPKSIETSVESHYIQFNLKKLLDETFPIFSDKVNINELISIKVELEHSIINGSNTELKLLTYPTFSQIRIFKLDTLFASKLIALLNRKWKTRVKGRDYYDYLFYIEKDVGINLNFLKNGLIKFKFLNPDENFNIDILKNLLINLFNTVDFGNIKNDVLPFIKNDDKYLPSLNKDIFLSTITLLHE